ncbi:porphobilinogen deaminase, dipyromethane cofactor binding domain-containing protein [Amanita rubescens]|nr:porphobilinogen deaminase, dipyromethane cofactor binding domain-containing protein [Amanita rubescens]
MTTNSSPARTFVLASRASQLAQIQTNIVLGDLQALYPPTDDPTVPKFSTSFMSTAGDKNQSQALYLLGGKALWTKELEVALKEDRVDMLVHSLKDVPTTLPEGCVIGAILEREDPVDSLVMKKGVQWKTLGDLPVGSAVGTSSVRRVAQLKRLYPGLKFLDVRGNLNTRLAKLDDPEGPYAALILAKAGLVRLGMGERISSDITPPTLLHAVSQGALGVEIRSTDSEALALCQRLTHWQTQYRCLAERACLRVLEGGCSVPVGVSTVLKQFSWGESGELMLTGCVTSLDGQNHVEETLRRDVTCPSDAEELGVEVAHALLKAGAKKILDDINQDRASRVQAAEKQDALDQNQAAKS